MISQVICRLLSDLPHVLWLSLGSSMVLQRAVFHPFPWRILHCVDGPLLLCAFICGWTFWLLPSLGNAKYWCSAGLPACVFWILVFSGIRPSSGPTRSYGSSNFSLSTHLHSVLTTGCYQFTCHQQLEGTQFSKTPSEFIVCRLFTDGILSVGWWYLLVGWICMRLIIPDIELSSMFFF